MVTSSFQRCSNWWQLIIFILIINKRFSLVQTENENTGITELSGNNNNNNNNNEANTNNDDKSRLELNELKLWPKLSRLWYIDHYIGDNDINYDDDYNNNDYNMDYNGFLPEQYKRSWHSLQKSWGKRSYWDYYKPIANQMKAAAILNSIYDHMLNDIENDTDNEISIEDRPTSWTKRDRKNSSWNNFRNLWGKRDTNNWNNLKGMWGKRNSGKWK